MVTNGRSSNKLVIDVIYLLGKFRIFKIKHEKGLALLKYPKKETF